ncbi:MAG: hypothetical protein AAGI90_07135 [Chlamydiota bacterium]
MLTNEAKKQILTSILETIECISDKSYQKRVWIEAKGPEVDDFDETCCHFFDLGECIFDKYEEYNLTEQQQKILDEFREKFESFNDGDDRPYLEADFIDTPEWEGIMKLAKDVLKEFDYKKQL